MNLYGGIEGGGTKFVCMVGSGPADIRAEARFPTTIPAETLGRAVAFFKEQTQGLTLSALGIGSFGPVDLDPASPTFGCITNTVNPGWANTPVVSIVQSELNIPVVMDTDVNAAAFGEYWWGAARGLDPIVYLTVGTGIGGGVVCQGKSLHGLMHPEVGHMLIPHDRDQDPFAGVCLFHGDCLEGLASGTAMKQRWGQPAETLPADHAAWTLEAHYLAVAVVNLILSHSPCRIVLGGGVMQHTDLFPLVRHNVKKYLNSYIQSPSIETIDHYIVPPALGHRSGALGAIALAVNSLG
jgi:fructokinase